MADFEKYSKESYKIHRDNGFYTEDMSIAEWAIVVMNEVAELVSAIGKNSRASVEKYETSVMKLIDKIEPSRVIEDKNALFELFIKDTIEDELADIAIATMNACEHFGLWVHTDPFYTSKSDCVSSMVLKMYGNIVDITRGYDKTSTVSSMLLSTLEDIAKHYCIDLNYHIAEKLNYNLTRGYLHGGEK